MIFGDEGISINDESKICYPCTMIVGEENYGEIFLRCILSFSIYYKNKLNRSMKQNIWLFANLTIEFHTFSRLWFWVSFAPDFFLIHLLDL